ncbi:MAG: hypothetical protein NZ937_08360 [Armatimonadetes bacterium]|nr:hypothetical protein [Armatimonadota bacterium]
MKEQRVCIARMKWNERNEPVGKVWKWHESDWKEPGIDGKVTPILPASVAWQ